MAKQEVPFGMEQPGRNQVQEPDLFNTMDAQGVDFTVPCPLVEPSPVDPLADTPIAPQPAPVEIEASAPRSVPTVEPNTPVAPQPAIAQEDNQGNGQLTQETPQWARELRDEIKAVEEKIDANNVLLARLVEIGDTMLSQGIPMTFGE